jgi:hypothetical protein
MLIAWLVLSGRLDVAGTSEEDMPVGVFLGSAFLAAIEGACELHWLLVALS